MNFLYSCLGFLLFITTAMSEHLSLDNITNFTSFEPRDIRSSAIVVDSILNQLAPQIKQSSDYTGLFRANCTILFNNRSGTTQCDITPAGTRDFTEAIEPRPSNQLPTQYLSKITQSNVLLATIYADWRRGKRQEFLTDLYFQQYTCTDSLSASLSYDISETGELTRTNSQTPDASSSETFAPTKTLAQSSRTQTLIGTLSENITRSASARSSTQSDIFSRSRTLSSSSTQTTSKSKSFTRSISLTVSSSASLTLTPTLTLSKSTTKSLSQLLIWTANITNTTADYEWKLLIANGTIGSPPSRSGHSMQAIDDNLYMFGGEDYSGNFYNDIWKFNGFFWSDITPVGIKPNARAMASGSSDNTNFYIFGGERLSDCLNDLWKFDIILETWSLITANGAIGSPPVRRAAASFMIGSDIYIFGGGGSIPGDRAWQFSSNLNDLWKFNGLIWNDITPAVSPSPRSQLSLTSIDMNSYLYGGLSDGNSINDGLWKYNSSSGWVSITLASSLQPGARGGYAMGTRGENLLMFGGYSYGGALLDDLWKFSTETGNWTQIVGISGYSIPSARKRNANLANINADLYLFGGQENNGKLNDLWRLQRPISTTNTFYLWNLMIANGTSGSPPPRASCCIHTVNGNLYMFGGYIDFSASAYNDMWKFDGTVWTDITPLTTKPSPRAGFASGVIGSNIYIYGGGVLSSSSKNDLWKFNTISETWTEIIANALPGSPLINWAISGSMIEDAFYIFSGTGYATFTKDLWKYNGSTWTDITSAVSPAIRSMASLTAVGTDMYMWGGCNTGCPNGLWKYNQDSNWTLTTPDNWTSPSLPGGQYGQVMSSVGQELFILGGANVGMCTQSNFWKFDIASSIWTRLSSTLLDSEERLICFYNSAMCNMNDDLYLFGGKNQNPSSIGASRNDLWRMHIISIGLSDIDIVPNPIVMNNPFNFSWRVQTIRGSNQHIATIDFNGTKKYTGQHINEFGSIILIAPNISDNFWVNLKIRDTLYQNATIDKIINFVLTTIH